MNIENLFTGRTSPINTVPYDYTFTDLPTPQLTEREKKLLKQQDLESDNETLFFKHSFLINPDINNYDKDADFRYDNYTISHIIEEEDILYHDFFKLISPNILKYIQKTFPSNEKPVKYTFVIHNENDRKSYSYIRNIKAMRPDLVIYFPTTKDITISDMEDEINNSISRKNYTDHDWLYSCDNFDTLTIIQERLTIPYIPHNNIKELFKTFKEEKCIICLDSKPNILFCNCGHLNICETCFNKLENNKCPKCRQTNKIIRKI